MKKHKHPEQAETASPAVQTTGQANPADQGYPRHNAAYWAKCIALVAFLLLWTWFVGSQTGWWFFNTDSSPSNTGTSTLQPLASDSTKTATTTGSGGSGGSGGSSGSGGGTTTNTTNTTNNGGGGGGGGGNPPAEGCTTTLQQFYNSITTGETKQEVIDAACQYQPECTGLSNVILGTQQVCTFSEGNDEVIVVFLNGQEVTRNKVGF